MTSEALILAAAFFCLAALYSSVGHAGASGYLATMALLGVAPATMRPTALALNLVVATLATYRFWRAGWTRWERLLPFAIASVPLAYFGGRIQVPVTGYRTLVGVVLLCTAVVLIWRARGGESTLAERPLQIPLVAAVGSGAAIGLLSGLTGTGGGIFLSPLLLLAGWEGPRGAAGLAAPFICLNSLAGLIGVQWAANSLPAAMPLLAASVLAGGWLGTAVGLQRLPPRGLLWALAAVLLIAGGKLLLPAH
ncbi:MAG: sulfite exporter TauE/SafE family protein [Steroidobacteraceae bacterium]